MLTVICVWQSAHHIPRSYLQDTGLPIYGAILVAESVPHLLLET
jgi:hypothetical protein